MKERGKKGVSIMVGYVLLVVIAVVMSVVVYAWLKTYTPADVKSCPEEVSLFVSSIECIDADNDGSDDLIVSVINNLLQHTAN